MTPGLAVEVAALLVISHVICAAVPPRMLLPEQPNVASTFTTNNIRQAAPRNDNSNIAIVDTTTPTLSGTNALYRTFDFQSMPNMDYYNDTPASSAADNSTLFTGSGVFMPNHVTGSDAIALRVSGVRPWSLFRQSTAMVVVLTFAYCVVFFLGIVNNSLVVSVIYRNRQMRTVTNYFIANLAIADILVCIIVVPITLLSNVFQGEFAGWLSGVSLLNYVF